MPRACRMMTIGVLCKTLESAVMHGVLPRDLGGPISAECNRDALLGTRRAAPLRYNRDPT